MKEKKSESRNQEYMYQMLDRLKSDCDYYLGHGNRHPQALWAGDEEGQISKMREIWNKLEEKPEWLTWEDINDYADKMGVIELPSTRNNTARKEIQDMLDRNHNKEKKIGLDESIEAGLDVLEQTEKEQTLEKPFNDFVYVYQLENPGKCGYGFMSYDNAKDKINLDDYKLTAKVPLKEEYDDIDEVLEYAFAYGNSNKEYYINNPKARSISVSDILEYKDKNYYVDSFGFVELNFDEKLMEANINTNLNNEDLTKTKEEIQKQLDDVEEIETMKKELDDKMDDLFEENKELKVENMSKEDIMACYISDINNFAYTYDKDEAQKEIDATLEDLKNDKDLDAKDKAMVMRFVRSTLLDRDIKFEDINYNEIDNIEDLEENKDIKTESQVSNYTLEEIGQCLKDKGNDFKLQITGADSKTKWLNIDKDDVQKIYNTLSYKKKKTESIKIGDKVKIINSNDYHNNKQGEVTYIDDEITTVKLDDGRSFNYDKNQIQKIEEDIKYDLGIEPGSDEEAQLDELTDRNLKDEFNALSKEEQEAYLELIPENGNQISSELIEELAELSDLDKDLLYWVINIRGNKIKEGKEVNKFPSSDFSSEKLSYSDLDGLISTFSKFKKFITPEQEKWLIETGFSVNELYEGLKEILSIFRNESFKDIISIDDYIKELDKTESLNESISTNLYNKIKNEPRSDKYEKGLKLRDEIVNAWKNNDLETAGNKWEELYRLFSSSIEDLDSSVTEEQTLRNNIELNEILSTIEDQCVYDVTDYCREKDYKKNGILIEGCLNITFDDIKQIIENLDFTYSYNSNLYGSNEPGIEIGQYTPLGEDWFETFGAGSPEIFINNLKDRVDDWDIEWETKPYIEMMGKRGVPDDEDALIEDAKWKIEQLKNLLKELQNIKTVKESKEIKTEALSQDLPDWLRTKLNRKVLTKYKSRYSNDRVPVMNIAWDKAKYVPAEIPQTARATDLKDANKLPVFKLRVPGYLGDNDSRTEIYVPGLLDPEIHGDLVNSRSYYLPISKASYKQLLPYIEEFGYIVLDDKTKTSDLRLSREKSREGSVERDRTKGQHPHKEYLGNGKYSDDVTWVTDKGFDKSGYPLDPERQVQKLAQMSLKDADSAADRIEKIYNDIEAVRVKIGKVLSEKTINDLKGNSDVEKWDTKMYRIERAVRYLDDAVKSYTNILKTIDEAKKSDESWIDNWLSRDFKRNIIEVKNDLAECNKILKEFQN